MSTGASATEPMLAQTARHYRVTLVSQGVRLLCKVVSVLVLARLVAPEEHGLYAMAGTVFGGLLLFRDLGLAAALVQAAELTEEQGNALRWFLPLVGAGLAVLHLALIPAAVWFFAEPRLTGLLAMLSLTFLLYGLGAFPRALLARQLRFAAINRIETTAAVLGTGAMIAAGALGAGAYAFGVFLLTVEAWAALAAWRVCGWHGRGTPRWSSLRPLFRPGTGFASSNALTYVLGQLDALLVGRWFGAAQLGPYARASQLLTLPSLHITLPLTQVTFATLSRLKPSSPGFVPHVRHCSNQIAYLTLPVAAACIALPHEIVRVVLGPGWEAAAPMLFWLAVSTAATSLAAVAQPLCLALGRTGRFTLLSFVAIPFTLLGVWLGRTHGPAGMAAGLAAANLALLLPRLLWAARDTPVRLGDFAATWAGPCSAAAAVALGLSLATRWLPPASPALRLCAGLAGGCAALGLLVIAWPRLRRELASIWQAVHPEPSA